MHAHHRVAKCLHMKGPDCCQRICIALEPLLAPRPHFAAPRARRAPTFRRLMEMPTFPAECVVNRSLPAFHFWSESIGLCRSQHLIKGCRVNWSLNRDTRRCNGGLFAAALQMRRHASRHRTVPPQWFLLPLAPSDGHCVVKEKNTHKSSLPNVFTHLSDF